jgi:hypothetical protein
MKARAWHTAEYRQYLKSPEWKGLRQEVFRIRGRRCEACGIGWRKRGWFTPKRWLTVHHVNYERLGSELMSDVRVLCNRDHANAHQADQSGRFRDLEAATDHVIERGKRRQRARRVIQERWQRLCLRLSSRNRHP